MCHAYVITVYGHCSYLSFVVRRIQYSYSLSSSCPIHIRFLFLPHPPHHSILIHLFLRPYVPIPYVHACRHIRHVLRTCPILGVAHERAINVDT